MPKILECDVVGCGREGICKVPMKYVKRKYKHLPILVDRNFLQFCIEHLEMLRGRVVKKKYGKVRL